MKTDINAFAALVIVTFLSIFTYSSISEKKTYVDPNGVKKEKILTEVKKDSLLRNAVIGDAHSASYNPNSNSFEVWLSVPDSDFSVKTEVFVKSSADFRLINRKIFDSLLVVSKDGNEYEFLGFQSR
jgi:predicted membrane protein